MTLLHSRILELKQGHSQYGHNGLLFAMTLQEAAVIDELAVIDEFVSECRRTILRLLKGYSVGYSEHLKSAFDVFSECSIYIYLRSKNVSVHRVPEGLESRPDFQLSYRGEEAYCEVKTLGWSEGSRNYNVAIEDGIAAQIDI